MEWRIHPEGRTTDKNMESKINYSVVGLFVLLLLAVSMLMAWWLYSGGSTRQYTSYLVYATDSVSGLNADSRVYFNGVDVGYIDSIQIDRSNPDKIRIRLSIDQAVPIRANTTAQLQPQGVTGLSVLNLKGGKGGQPLSTPPGECCPVIDYEPSLFSKLEGGLNETMVRLVAISERLDGLLNEDNVQAIDQTLANLNAVSTALAEERGEIRSLIRNAARTMENTADISAEGHKLVARADTTLRSLDQAISRVSSTMDSFDQTAERVAVAAESTVSFSRAGERAAGQISEQTLPEIGLLIRDVRALSRRLATFTNTLDEDPSQVVFGGSNRAPGPGEGPGANR